MTSTYPAHPEARNSWIMDRRGPRNAVDPYRPYAFLLEQECSAERVVVPVATVFLTNRECPWRCAMCDLWKNTVAKSVPAGAIPQQIEHALAALPVARQIKLYNSGSFFDERAIPKEDYAAISRMVGNFDRTIVECHPALVGMSCVSFRDLIGNRLEVAMGLETVHPEVLDRLNKRMTLDQFARSSEYLQRNGIDLRVFILVQPPFMHPEEALHWAQRSLDFAFDCGAAVATLIPTRGGNGAMEALANIGEFAPPALATVEAAARYGLGLKRGRVFVDTWELCNRPNACQFCLGEIADRLHRMNLSQQILPSIECSHCEGKS